MATEIELLAQIVALLSRDPLSQVGKFIEYASKHGMAKPTHYQVAVNTVREFPGIRANFLRVVFDCTAAVFRAQGGDVASIEINGGAPIPFPDCPEETGGTVYDSTANVDSSIGHVAVFRMPIYDLKIRNLIAAGATNIVHVYLLNVGEYEQHAITRLDTQDTNLKDTIDALGIVANNVTTSAGTLAGYLHSIDATLDSWDTNTGGLGQGARTFEGVGP